MATTLPTAIIGREIRVRGVVQGVGFRPHVYNLAKHIGIRGFVRNSSSGVTIAAEGEPEAVQRFVELLRLHPPDLARIEEFTVHPITPVGAQCFVIQPSVAEPGEFVLVSPDVATCAECWREVTDPGDRRYGYPFTNCTNCGPRYTIIRDIPYDRPATTMAPFRMCADCEAEYHDPGNRRFHAQPNACPACGPGIALIPTDAAVPPDNFSARDSLAVLQDVRRLLREGAIVAIRGVGGFHLACDATNEAAVRSLRERKRRSDKPFAIMARDVRTIADFCELTDADRTLLQTPEHPIVILPRRPGGPITASVAPGNDTLGVMTPYTPLQWFLFGEDAQKAADFPALVMTSGNISDEPIVTSNEEAWQRLRPVADWFLFHNRDIYMRTDDSVARTLVGKPRVLRRSRGYAPHPIDLHRSVTELLACGAELKNAFCITKGHYAIVGQHIGDADNYETLEFFRESLDNLKKLFRIEPQAVAHDLHPHYLTSRFARELGLPTIGVQHHHAHIASCMAENGIGGPVIGVALDGTGYGTDGQIWGGEFLVADYAGLTRRAHMRYMPLPGGDAAVRQNWRSALSCLREAFGDGLPERLRLIEGVPDGQKRLVLQMLEKNLNCVLTSSCGRLFDAVSALLGIRSEATFEGQPAIELEMAAVQGIEDTYPFTIEDGDPAQIDVRPTIRAIVVDRENSHPTGVMASRFHNTVAAIIADVCGRIRVRDRLSRVCLSGGVFQNAYLLERTVRALRRDGFEVFLHSQVPPNDGGIALGQAAIANELLQRGAC